MSDPMNDVKAAFVLAAEHANAASAEAASRIFDAALAIHDTEVSAEAFQRGLYASGMSEAAMAEREAAIRADEREKAAQRVDAALSELHAYAFEVRMDWSDFDGRSNLDEVSDAIAKAVAAARDIKPCCGKPSCCCACAARGDGAE